MHETKIIEDVVPDVLGWRKRMYYASMPTQQPEEEEEEENGSVYLEFHHIGNYIDLDAADSAAEGLRIKVEEAGYEVLEVHVKVNEMKDKDGRDVSMFEVCILAVRD